VISIGANNLKSEFCNNHSFQNDKIYKIRAHHGLCMFYFKGKGYSSEFVENMTSFKNYLESNPLVLITCKTDVICDKCPNNVNGKCITEDKVSQYDRRVLSKCRLTDGDIIHYDKFRNLILHNIIIPGKREEVCGNCMWTTLCRNPWYYFQNIIYYQSIAYYQI